MKLKTIIFVCIISLIISIPAFASEYEKFFELDLTDFVPSSSGSSGAVNAGTGKDAVINIYDCKNVTLTPQRLTNIYRENVTYIEKTNKEPLWVTVSHATNISDVVWEEGSTFSFWADLSTSVANKLTCICEYKMTYSSGGSTSTATFNICEITQENTSTYLWNIGDSNDTAINMNNSKGWTHVMITNPAPSSGGTKTMKLYINGEYVKSKTITLPKGAEAVSATLTFGGKEDKTYVPSYSRFANIDVYKGELKESEIFDIYNSIKDTFVPLTYDIRFNILNSDGEAENTLIEYRELKDGLTAVMSVDNPNTDEDVNASLFAASYSDNDMNKAVLLDDIEIPAGSVGYELSKELDDITDSLNPGDELVLYLWTDNLTPLLPAQRYVISKAIVNAAGGYRLIIPMNSVPSAAYLTPDVFTVTAQGKKYDVDRCLYYPLSRELHLCMDNVPNVTELCSVEASITGFGGGYINLNLSLPAVSAEDNPIYRDSIKYVALYKDNLPVGEVYEDGIYTIEVCAVLQGESRNKPVAVTVYKNSDNTQIGSKTASFTEEDYKYTLTCELKAGDTVYAKLN